MKEEPCAQDKDRPGGCIAEPPALHEACVGYGNPERHHEMPVEYRDRQPEQEPDDSEQYPNNIFWFHGGLGIWLKKLLRVMAQRK